MNDATLADIAPRSASTRSSSTPRPPAAAAARGLRPALADQPAAAGEFQAATGAATGRSGSSWSCSSCRCSPSSSPTTGRSSPPTRARSCFRSSSTIRRRSSAASSRATDYRDPFIAGRDQGEWLDDLAADPLLLRHASTTTCPTPAPAPPTWMLTRRRNAAPHTPQAARRPPTARVVELELARHRRPGPRRAWRGSSTASASRCCSA